MKKLLFVSLVILTSCYDFDYVEPEVKSKKWDKPNEQEVIQADTVKRKCAVGG